MYIEKDLFINEEIDKFRYLVIFVLFERRDVIIVVSVFCIYSLGSFEDYLNFIIFLCFGMIKDRDEVIREFIRM